MNNRKATVLPNSDLGMYMDKISGYLHTMNVSRIEVGRLLLEAENKLKESEYKELTAWTGLGKRSLEKLKQVARNKLITSNVDRLPKSWGTLVEISRLNEVEFKELVDDRKMIKRESTRYEVIKVIKDHRGELAEERGEEVRLFTIKVKGKVDGDLIDKFNQVHEIMEKVSKIDGVIVNDDCSYKVDSYLEKDNKKMENKEFKEARDYIFGLLKSKKKQLGKNYHRDIGHGVEDMFTDSIADCVELLGGDRVFNIVGSMSLYDNYNMDRYVKMYSH
ncbi:hypothetical protein BOW53_04205 [Solemya pervernicosa gill symbiont]|uniref:Uncharacterized protein n=1 Tax=Solemya pervernicosa gill symbiont TaxID=642797 RepID=A0A1T2L8R2_9GAMM|nr:hypothetical protein [Solemya pervernicosa gill symbiont]OOZ41326.1 hypothetical protein BOW53_04205 [Solemya pervernicosa gill symbiont]